MPSSAISRSLSPDIRARRAGVPWQQIAGLRDVLIHQYFGVDLELVWEFVEIRLPELKGDVDTLLGEIE